MRARCAGKQAVLTSALLPAAGVAVQKVVPIPGLAAVPLAILSPVIGSIIGAVRGLIPV